jgi:outer membrane protein TolC
MTRSDGDLGEDCIWTLARFKYLKYGFYSERFFAKYSSPKERKEFRKGTQRNFVMLCCSLRCILLRVLSVKLPFVVFCSTCLIPCFSFAQHIDSAAIAVVMPVDTSGNDITLPPLDTLYEWARLLSPTLKEQDALIEKTIQDEKRIKKILLDPFKLNANLQYGNYGDPLINALETGYSAGASVQFSLYQIFGYKNQVKLYAAEKKVAQYKKDELNMDLKKIVTILYNDIMSQKNILKIHSDATYAAYAHVKMAEKEFSEGSVAIGELSRVSEIYTKAQVEYEQSINDLKNYYMELEQLVGQPLNGKKPDGQACQY